MGETNMSNACKARLLSLDEAIAHAWECADETPCGQNHRQLAEWLEELRGLKRKLQKEAKGMRRSLEEISRLNDLWYDTYPTKDGQTSIHDDIEYEVIRAKKFLEEMELSKLRPKNGGYFGQFGNSAAMRQALLDVHEELRRYVAKEIDETSLCFRIMNHVNAALRPRPRNCDRFATLKDAVVAWGREDQGWQDWPDEDDVNDLLNEITACQMHELVDWLFDIASDAGEPEKGGGK